MYSFYDRASMAYALTLDLEPRLRQLLSERIAALTEDLIDYTEYLVVEETDSEGDIVRHVGFSPLVEPIEGARYGELAFQPFWDLLADRGGWYEMIVTFGSAFAHVLLIEHRDDALGELCREYT